MSIEKAPMVFHTDFDGTAVEVIEWGPKRIAKIRSARQAGNYAVDLVRNMAKYPLQGMAGYGDFVRGVSTTGVGMGDIITRRNTLRRPVTEWTARNNGLYAFFGQESSPSSNRVRHRVVYAKSEMGKAAQVVREAAETPVAFADDKPHKVGAELLTILTRFQGVIEPADRKIVLGVVDGPEADERIDRLFGMLPRISRNISCDSSSDSMSVVGDGFQLEVVALQPYSYEAGQAFGQYALQSIGINTDSVTA